MDYYPRQENKDHVLVNITLSVMIGVNPSDDDTPGPFCNLLREAVKSTGAVILTSSMVPQKRLHFEGSAREKILRETGILKDNPLDGKGDNYGH